MTYAKVLVVLLANQGYWFGGQTATVSIQWATKSPRAEVVLVWDLLLGQIRIAGDRVALSPGEKPTTIQIAPPEVRVPTIMQFVCRLQHRDTGKQISSSEAVVHVYPKNVLAGLDKRLAGKSIIVWDRPDGLPALLEKARISLKRVGHLSELQLASADMILVGHDQIDATLFAQSALIGRARAGASVIVFEQTRISVLAGYALVGRPNRVSLKWRTDHPLVQRIGEEALQSWLTGAAGDLYASRLPVDEPALEIGYWPPEVQSNRPGPIDALLLTKTIGSGRIVLCQIPLGQWESDPRSQLLLANALDYSCTRAEPTPSPSQRRVDRQPQPTTVPTITIPPGAQP